MTAVALRTLAQTAALTAGAYLTQKAVCTNKPTDSKMWFATQLILTQAALKGVVSLAARKWTSLAGLLPLPVLALTAVALAAIAYRRADASSPKGPALLPREDTAEIAALKGVVTQLRASLDSQQPEPTKESILATLQPEGNASAFSVSQQMQDIAKDVHLFITVIKGIVRKASNQERVHLTVDNFIYERNVMEMISWATTWRGDKDAPETDPLTFPHISALHQKITSDTNSGDKRSALLHNGLKALAQAMKSTEGNATEITTFHSLFEKALEEGFTDPRVECERQTEDKTSLDPKAAANALEGLIEIQRLLDLQPEEA